MLTKKDQQEGFSTDSVEYFLLCIACHWYMHLNLGQFWTLFIIISLTSLWQIIVSIAFLYFFLCASTLHTHRSVVTSSMQTGMIAHFLLQATNSYQIHNRKCAWLIIIFNIAIRALTRTFLLAKAVQLPRWSLKIPNVSARISWYAMLRNKCFKFRKSRPATHVNIGCEECCSAGQTLGHSVFKRCW